MKKVLFLIHDLGPGGAEKVLVNLVNNMDPKEYDITVMALFGGGVNEQFLASHVRYIACFKRMIPGNSHLMKLLTPKQLHKWLIKDKYDIEISYLEGPSARIISGCPDDTTKLLSWIHCKMTPEVAVLGFRSMQEAKACYNRLDRIVCVSKTVEDAFQAVLQPESAPCVVYNTNESDKIIEKSVETVPEGVFREGETRLCAVGKLIPVKAYDRLVRIHARLRREGYPVHTYLMGVGALQAELEKQIEEEQIADSFTLLGYQTNPYKFEKNCDIFVCSSLSEGFSTAATEALIVGTPVCTVEVSGMKEMLGENNEYGTVTENSEDALYEGIKKLLDDPALLAHYKAQAVIRGKDFSTENTVRAVQDLLLEVCHESH